MNTPPREGKSPRESCFCHPLAHEVFDLDVLLRALANPCRREVLCLLDAEPEWSLGDLAASLGTVATVRSPVSGPEAEAVLYHRHLPILEEARLIVFDDESHRIARGENFLPVRAMVDAAVGTMSGE